MVDKQEIAILKVIGSRMREARGLCGESASSPLSLNDASKMLGVDREFLQRLESGIDVENCPLRLVKKAAELYDISIDYLFDMSDDWENSDEVKWQRQIGRGLHEYHMQELAKLAAEYQRQQRKQEVLIDVVSKLLPAITDVFDSLQTFKKANRRFEEMKVGSQLAYRVLLANQLGNECKQQLVRGKVIPLPENKICH
jgi:CRISPR/Cas system CSM-associated protein Csm2 small subunit